MKKDKKKSNPGIKLLIIVLTSILFLYQLNRAGFRIDGPSRDGAIMYLMTVVISIGLLLWYLSSSVGLWVLISLIAFQLIYSIYFGTPTTITHSSGAMGNYTSMANAIILYTLFHLKVLQNIAPLPITEVDPIDQTEE